jgi:hypothetical protein
MAKDKKVSEDAEKRAQEEIQKMTDEEIRRMEELSRKKRGSHIDQTGFRLVSTVEGLEWARVGDWSVGARPEIPTGGEAG